MADRIAYGDQRRVDIALALVGQPSLMLLDEPAAGLSTAETMTLFEHLLTVVRERDVTALVVEHDVEAVFRFCDTITALDLGRVPRERRPGRRAKGPSSDCGLFGDRGMSFIDVKGLRAGYGNSVVLRDIDLQVDEGEFVAVVGKNGAGKSTLLMSFFGGTNITGGSIAVGASNCAGCRPIARPSRALRCRRRVG